ncbi:hypothetical protein Q5424_25910 [Conexibacter sp. JD483]|uniref:hypothetical protein n=1 Tax=unclassified Conexibacter TaxID=2627773 RepID=UPI00271D8DC1|nr:MULTISPECIES: hypothetical protein [unclassified Conexibacter]MDO8187787.1 hypothetical protein [Conexibacter sp. CPCC 205706]MDO8201975.1 hypothetical protein [Conexibacter sp. CPCC 205762]MDR9372561.1 hypothetical protein [Conexibacter sp. JD483]
MQRPRRRPVRLTAVTRGVGFARAALDGDRVSVLATMAGEGRLRVAATDDDGSVATVELAVRVEPYPAPRGLALVCFDGCALGADGAVALGFRCGPRAARELPGAGDADRRPPPARVGDAAGRNGHAQPAARASAAEHPPPTRRAAARRADAVRERARQRRPHPPDRAPGAAHALSGSTGSALASGAARGVGSGEAQEIRQSQGGRRWRRCTPTSRAAPRSSGCWT